MAWRSARAPSSSWPPTSGSPRRRPRPPSCSPASASQAATWAPARCCPASSARAAPPSCCTPDAPCRPPKASAGASTIAWSRPRPWRATCSAWPRASSPVRPSLMASPRPSSTRNGRWDSTRPSRPRRRPSRSACRRATSSAPIGPSSPARSPCSRGRDAMSDAKLGPSAQIDTFTRDNLPPSGQRPDFLLAGFDYPERLNIGVELTDRMVQKGFGDNTALIGNGRRRTYKELTDWTNRLARALVENYGVRPGNRVLIRSANNPAMVACWLAATKAGAVVVNTMPMLRAGELAQIVDKARIALALCDTRLMDDLVACAKDNRFLEQVVGFDGTANHDAELDRIALTKPVRFEAVATGRDDVALLAFTSGTTGMPKATMHFHRDLLVIADGYAREVLGVTPDDVFVGSPPLAFTFGLGLAIF